MHTTKQIADQLVTMCREGKVEETKQLLFTEETLSIEPGEGILPRKTRGLAAIQKKAELFIGMVEEFHGDTISDPLIAGDFFSVVWKTDIQMKGEKRKTSEEICVYQVKEGKIISERFFY